jgi:hypothetical protein
MAAALLAMSALLLVAAGGLKVVTPAPASDALAVAGLPSHPLLVRIGSLVEVVLGLAALVWAGSMLAGFVALSFAGFAGFVELLRRRPDAPSCGCFGGEGEVPSLRHVVGNLLLAIGCVVAAATHAPSMVSLVREQPATGVVFVVAATTAAWLASLVLRGGPGAEFS